MDTAAAAMAMIFPEPKDPGAGRIVAPEGAATPPNRPPAEAVDQSQIPQGIRPATV